MFFVQIEMYYGHEFKNFNVDFGIDLRTGILTNETTNLKTILKEASK